MTDKEIRLLIREEVANAIMMFSDELATHSYPLKDATHLNERIRSAALTAGSRILNSSAEDRYIRLQYDKSVGDVRLIV